MLEHKINLTKAVALVEKAHKDGPIDLYVVPRKSDKIRRWTIDSETRISAYGDIVRVYSHSYNQRFPITDYITESIFQNYLLAWGFVQWRKIQPK